MGSERVLAAVLTRLRTALRIDGVQLLAGHGVGDASYRPPHLPYASVVGPLAIETEAERTCPNRVVRVRNAGHLDGAARSATDVVPSGPGTVELIVDGVTSGTVPVDFGPVGGEAFTAIVDGVPVGATVAATLQAAIRAAVAAGAFREDAAAVTAPARLAELAAVTARWDQLHLRLVVASGRRGPLSGPPSEAPPSTLDVTPGRVADALGLTGDGARTHPGRITRSRDLAPTAVAVDVRVDLWASSQGGLATMVDAWTAATPIRAELLLEPTPLAADVAPGDTSVHLAVGALPRISSTVLSAGTAGSFVDRLSGRPPRLTGAVVDAGGLTLGGTATADYRMIPAPPVPIAWQPHPPGARGWAVETLLRIAPGAADGAQARVLEILAGPRSVLRLDVSRSGNRYLLRGSATSTDGGDLGGGSVAVPGASLETGPARVCVLVASAEGAVRIFADGATPETAEEPAPGLTATPGDVDVLLRLGDPDGAGLDVTISDVVVHARPVGQADPRLRSGSPVAVRWPPGSPLHLGTSENGFATRGGEFLAYVLRVDGDEVHLDRAVPQSFPRSRTVAHQGALFAAQRQLRRHDDLMNRIYRVALEYRVSTFLDDVAAAVGAPLVEVSEVEVSELARLLAEQSGPPPPHRRATHRVGVGAVITTPAPSGPPVFSGLGASPSDR